jgi:hypothetical protein
MSATSCSRTWPMSTLNHVSGIMLKWNLSSPPTPLIMPEATFCRVDRGFINHTSCPLWNCRAQDSYAIKIVMWIVTLGGLQWASSSRWSYSIQCPVLKWREGSRSYLLGGADVTLPFPHLCSVCPCVLLRSLLYRHRTLSITKCTGRWGGSSNAELSQHRIE